MREPRGAAAEGFAGGAALAGVTEQSAGASVASGWKVGGWRGGVGWGGADRSKLSL